MEVIFTASMDGTNRTKLVTIDVEWPSAFTIDTPAKRLYWVDLRKSTIESSRLDGGDRHIIRELNFIDRPKSLDVIEDILFVVLNNNTILKLHKFGKENISNINMLELRTTDIKLIHVLKQNQSISNPCIQNPCHKTAICMLSSTNSIGRTCVCSDNLRASVIENGGTVCNLTVPKAELCNLNCNFGSCSLASGKPKCVCPAHYDGKFCDHYICSGYCENRGICYVDIGRSNPASSTRKCRCQPQWTGERCEISVEMCQQKCHNGGTCNYSMKSEFETCTCKPGFTGAHCENCLDLKCENSGICIKNMKMNISECNCTIG